jgi:hypothetical protein
MERGGEESFALEFLFPFCSSKKKNRCKENKNFVFKRLHKTQLKFFESTYYICFLGVLANPKYYFFKKKLSLESHCNKNFCCRDSHKRLPLFLK